MQWIHRLEPMWWGLFSVGGTIVAVLLPVHVFLNNIAVPLGWITPGALDYSEMSRLVSNPLVKVYLIVLMVPALFHAAHRMRLLPGLLGLGVSKRAMGPVAYLSATALAVAGIVAVVLAP